MDTLPSPFLPQQPCLPFVLLCLLFYLSLTLPLFPLSPTSSTTVYLVFTTLCSPPLHSLMLLHSHNLSFPSHSVLCINQSLTLRILSPFSLAIFSLFPHAMTPPYPLLYIPATKTCFPNLILLPLKCILTPSCTHRQSHVQCIRPQTKTLHC